MNVVIPGVLQEAEDGLLRIHSFQTHIARRGDWAKIEIVAVYRVGASA